MELNSKRLTLKLLYMTELYLIFDEKQRNSPESYGFP